MNKTDWINHPRTNPKSEQTQVLPQQQAIGSNTILSWREWWLAVNQKQNLIREMGQDQRPKERSTIFSLTVKFQGPGCWVAMLTVWVKHSLRCTTNPWVRHYDSSAIEE